ncbi:MAG: hypothetical protein ACI8PZ_001120 [Myxococcota bacterium]|jgi:hypothetical protein
MDAQAISDALEALSNTDTARRQRKQQQPLRGLRGTPLSEVARIAAASWTESRPVLPDDEGELNNLFASAWEDGLVAIGLLAACIPDYPEEALELGLSWLTRLDDVATGDALGWLVLGGGSLASGRGLASLGRPDHIAARRAIVMAGMAALPEPIEGPSAAPLRARLSEKRVQFVEEPLSNALTAHVNTWLRDESPAVRKGLRRLLRSWTRTDAAAVVAWGDSVRGGLPRLLRDEVNRARRRADRGQE